MDTISFTVAYEDYDRDIYLPVKEVTCPACGQNPDPSCARCGGDGEVTIINRSKLTDEQRRIIRRYRELFEREGLL